MKRDCSLVFGGLFWVLVGLFGMMIPLLRVFDVDLGYSVVYLDHEQYEHNSTRPILSRSLPGSSENTTILHRQQDKL
jgi:hypothetical protein